MHAWWVRALEQGGRPDGGLFETDVRLGSTRKTDRERIEEK